MIPNEQGSAHRNGKDNEEGKDKGKDPGWSARSQLRRLTREAHGKVDSLPLLRGLMSRSVTVEDYRLALTGLYRVNALLCPVLDEGLGDHRHLSLRPTDLLRYLELDLNALGGDLSLPKGLETPTFSTADEALGAWYVLEGSALGGVTIARRLRRVLGGALPLAYFGQRASQRAAANDSARNSGEGDSPPCLAADRWSVFEAHLVDRLEEPATLEGALVGARASFAFVYRVIDGLAAGDSSRDG